MIDGKLPAATKIFVPVALVLSHCRNPAAASWCLLCLRTASELPPFSGVAAGPPGVHVGIGATVADPRWLLPVPAALPELVARHNLVVTVEDGCRAGGFGAALTLACADAGLPAAVRVLGLPREFLEHGERGELLAAHGLDAPGIVRACTDALASTEPPGRIRWP